MIAHRFPADEGDTPHLLKDFVNSSRLYGRVKEHWCYYLIDEDMKRKEKTENIPQSRLTGYVSVIHDLDTESGEKLVFMDGETALSEANGKLSVLITSPASDIYKVPIAIQKRFHQLRTISLSLPMQAPDQDSVHPLPKWISDHFFPEELILRNINLESLFPVNKERLRLLILGKVTCDNKARLLDEISQIKTLEILVHKNLFTESEISEITGFSPRLLIMDYDVYYKGIKN